MNLTSALERLAVERSRDIDILRYAIAVVAVIAAALAWWGTRQVVIPEVLGIITVALIAGATLLATWIAGTGPGLTATALGAVALLFYASGPQHAFAQLTPRDVAVIVTSTVLSALIAIVVGRLRASRTALVRALPDIERRARDRANDAALRRIEEEQRATAAAKADVADIQRVLQERKSAALTASAARAKYLAEAALAVRLPLHAIERYAARLRAGASDANTPLQDVDTGGVVTCEEHIGILLDTVLAPVRVESGQLGPKIADVSLPEVVKQASALIQPFVAAHGSTIEYGPLDVPHVRADAALLTHVLARLVLEEALTGGQLVLRLEAREDGDGVTLECHASSDESLTGPAAERSFSEQGRESVNGAIWSSLAAVERVAEMGGSVTMGAGRGAGSGFAIWLPTKSASAANESVPLALWPPIAFELPRATGASPVRRRP